MHDARGINGYADENAESAAMTRKTDAGEVIGQDKKTVKDFIFNLYMTVTHEISTSHQITVGTKRLHKQEISGKA